MLKIIKKSAPVPQLPGPQRREPRLQAKVGHIRIEDVSIYFGTGPQSHLAVAETSIDIQPGQFVCILGPSGCGKSTLLNAVAGYVKPTSGQVLLDGKPITGPGPDRGMVFQQYSLFPWKTVRENVAFGPRIQGRGEPTPEAIADTFIDMVGLTKFAKRYPAELSGGM